MVDFKEFLRKAIKETSAVARDMKGLKVEEFKMVGAHKITTGMGKEIIEYTYMVLCSWRAPEDEPNKVTFEVGIYDNGSAGAIYNGNESEYRKYKVEA